MAGADRPAQEQRQAAPTVSLPKGGGAIRGIGEKFGANPATGTGSISLPFPASTARADFAPALTLTYDSGAGNGPFGFGWALSQPSITRKTDKGLPRYRDGPDPDVFLLSDAEDLVPVYRRAADGSLVRDSAGRAVIHEDELDGHLVRRYRPRVEKALARVERWTRIGAPDDVHWRTVSKENFLTVYGGDGNSRITDPEDPRRIFSWLICELRDDRGNAALFRYKAEDGAGVDLERACERNRGPRDDPRRTANRYLKRIHYGNRRPVLGPAGERPHFVDAAAIDAEIAAGKWMFEVVLDYGDHDPEDPLPKEDRPWASRPDPFSSYRSGFEVRTERRCRRILMFHHFEGEQDVGRDCLVRSLDLTYSSDADPAGARSPVHTFLTSATQLGYRRAGGGYARRGLPPVEFEYSEPVVQDVVEEIDPESLENLPVGLAERDYRWIDLHGEGIPGILTEQGGTWFYKRNLSALPVTLPDGRQVVRAAFAPVETVALTPNVELDRGVDFMDLAGDGQQDVVMLGGPTPGLYEHDGEEGWKPFRAFASRLNIDPRDPNLRHVDLDGDGRADVLITEEDALVWHPSLGEEGFGPAQRVAQALDEEKGPRVVFSDDTESIHLADLSGDGLSDIARVRNGEVCYWPNLGHGRFGPKVTMDNSPWFDDADHFDPGRIRLADIDGSGTTDVIYLHGDGVRLYFNQSGNAWSRPQALDVFPRVSDLSNVVVTDLLGNGTASLVWSSSLPADAGRPMRHVSLMGERKPHLLVRSANNLGAETRVEYASSTRYYLEDRRAGRPWITKLPFPVHVVERVEVHDLVSRNRFVTRYAYHHGHYDGEEREFRGFGMVEQWDTEALGSFEASGALPESEDGMPASHVAPVHTRTWFHTGMHAGRGRVADALAGEYFREPGASDGEARELLLPDTELPNGLSAEEEREACRALKGSMLRQETYADDAGPGADADARERAAVPYSVIEQSYAVRPLQPREDNAHAVFLTHEREEIAYHYERDPADPRVEHSLALEVDDHGNVLKKATVGYGRRAQVRVAGPDGQPQQVPNPGLADLDAADRAKQTRPLLAYTENRFTNAVDSADAHRVPVTCEEASYELTGFEATGPAGRYQPADLVEPDPTAPPESGRLRARPADEMPYEGEPTDGPCRRLTECVRTLYRRDDLTALLPLGELEPLAVSGEGYRLAFTPGLLEEAFRRPRPGEPDEPLLPDPEAVLGGRGGDQGGYVRSQTLKADGRFPAADADDHWWMPGGRSFHSADPEDGAAAELAEAQAHFFLTRRYRDPFGQDTAVAYDGNDLLLRETRDPLGNRVSVGAFDYRVLQASLVVDANGNRTQAAFDTAGMVVGIALMGKAPPAPEEGDTLDGFSVDLTDAERDGLFEGDDPLATAAGLLEGATSRIVYDPDRFHRTRLAAPDDPAQWQPPGTATLDRETHASDPLPPHGLRIQLTLAYSDGFGREVQKKVQAEPGPIAEGGPVAAQRWVGSGWKVFNNKGKPVREYEPFFSSTQRYEFGVVAGVSPVLFYDPLGRVAATLRPDHTYEKAVLGPWRTTTFDASDTCAPRGRETGDPRTDPDIGGLVAPYFAALPESPPWKTWHEQRIGGALGPHEKTAAERSAAHADTPTTDHVDVLGRPFLTVSQNRVVCPGHALDGTEEVLTARTELDIEGNQRTVRDAVQQAGDPLGRVVMRIAYDMLGNRVRQLSMEAGARWMLDDAVGKQIRSWDDRGHNRTTTYDELRRPVSRTVRGTDAAASDPATLGRDAVVERIEYGEPGPNASAAERARAQRLNLRTRVFRHFDGAGVVTHARLDDAGDPVAAYDFKGGLLHTNRRLTRDYRATTDWSLDPELEDESFQTSARHDALGRVVQKVLPHSSEAGARRHVIQPAFNEAKLLERLDVWLERPGEPAGLLDPSDEEPGPLGVAAIEYDAKGQRLGIDYKNGSSTRYRYDAETFRLLEVTTRRGSGFPADERVVQSLHYTHDAIGDITHVGDGAQQKVFFRNQLVDADGDYTYDALHRLVQATGREHLGQQGAPPAAPDAFNTAHTGRPHPNTQDAMGRYVERYTYDVVGNILELQHRGSDPVHAGWTRAYTHDEASLIEDGSGGTAAKTSNRLTRTTLNANGAGPADTERYEHDRHGSMVRMPHVGGGAAGPNLHWDHADRLRAANLGGGGEAFYAYDATGGRVRKVREKAPGLVEERIYIDDYEVFRRHPGPIGTGEAVLERETVHLMDDRERVAIAELRTAGSDPAPPRLIRYQLATNTGSVGVELDEQARVVTYEEYAPYGSTTYQAVRSATETPKRYRFTGRERDEETGLSLHGVRYYAPWLGRWTSADPEGLADGPNLYRYARGSPLVVADTTGTYGTEKVTPEMIAAAAAALRYVATTTGAATAISGGAAVAGTAAVSTTAATGTGAGAAAAPAAAAGGGSFAAGAAVVAAQGVAAVAMGLAVRLHMQRGGSIARYGNPYGMSSRDIAFPVLRQAQKLRSDPFPLPAPAPDPKPGEETKRRRPRPGRIYVTYTKYNTKTGRYYSGRTSMEIDLNQPWLPQAEAAVSARDASHHIDEDDEPKDPAFEPAQLDKYAVGFAVDYAERYRDVGYLAIRGREQQLIDFYGKVRHKELGLTTPFTGGAHSDTKPGEKLTENKVRGVAKDNVLGEVFHAAATVTFNRELAPFTGNRVTAPP